MEKKGIILAGGTGSRLKPITRLFNKQLLPVYDKPMIYYALSTLMLLNIKNILIITSRNQLDFFKYLLGDGASLGISIKYKIQEKPRGLADGILISKDFIKESAFYVALGDNIFHGSSLINQLKPLQSNGSTIYLYSVKDPERYGIVELSKKNKAISIIEKPNNPKSNLAITGLYYFDNSATEKVNSLKLSKRSELEITDLIKMYLKDDCLYINRLSRGIAWFDTGTPDSLLDAACYVKTLEQRQGERICCPEEIAWRNKWISDKELIKRAEKDDKSIYGQYLLKLID